MPKFQNREPKTASGKRDFGSSKLDRRRQAFDEEAKTMTAGQLAARTRPGSNK